MLKSIQKKGLLISLFVLLMLASAVPAFAATFPDDGTYEVEYTAYPLTSLTPSYLNSYIATEALVDIDSGVYSVTVEFTAASFVQSFSVYDGTAFVAATPTTAQTAGNYAFTFTVADLADLDDFINVQLHIDIPASEYPPTGYQHTREARLLFDTNSAVEVTP